ncbi:cyclic nucleotide-binding domain protein [mine drainage metagenome]|uniref:Cyclic nucleotide-binding domain protein n=1 Tax=mine drainage metagenome TaxID=410659 RepID=A0A1J5PJR7_9ZZZZ
MKVSNKQITRPYDQCHMNLDFTQINPELDELLPKCLHEFCSTAAREKGEVLFATGEKPAQMYFVGEGEVVLERLGAQGSSVVLQRTLHGFVGEASLESARYHCDGKVVASSQITKIPIQELREAMDHDSEFSSRWISMLNREVKRLR